MGQLSESFPKKTKSFFQPLESRPSEEDHTKSKESLRPGTGGNGTAWGVEKIPGTDGLMHVLGGCLLSTLVFYDMQIEMSWLLDFGKATYFQAPGSRRNPVDFLGLKKSSTKRRLDSTKKPTGLPSPRRPTSVERPRGRSLEAV